MKSRFIYGVAVLGFCAATAVVVGLRLRPTLGISGEQAVLAGTRFAHAVAPQLTPAAKQRVLERYARMPLRFEAHPEAGQRAYMARGSGYTLLLRPTEAVWTFQKGERQQGIDNRRSGFISSLRPPIQFGLRAPQETGSSFVETAVVRMKLVGASPAAGMRVRDQLSGRVNYFLGNDPKKWRANIPSYANVHYQGVYPGVDLVFYGNQGQLEYDFIVAPGADPNAIKLRFEGAGKLEVDTRGDLALKTAAGEICLRKPLVFQEVGGTRREIAGGYALTGAHEVGFEVASYDMREPLVIDPVMVYSTYLGGNNPDEGFAIAIDPDGSAYATGWTFSFNFPTENPFQPEHARCGGFDCIDAFVTKFDASGSALVYSTYLGGSFPDWSNGIAVDAEGSAYVTGITYSADFPTTAKAFQSTLMGTGRSDAFVTKLDPGGSLTYSTYLGGSGWEEGHGIAVDAKGNAYVTGGTTSVDFPTADPLQPSLRGQDDAFVTKFDPSGSALVYSTYLGGGGSETGFGIALDADGNAYVAGDTNSADFPTAKPFQPGYGGGMLDAFVTRLDASGTALLYSTYLGGSDLDEAFGIAVDGGGGAYVTGWTFSADFPTVNPFQPDRRGIDAFVTKFHADGSVVYSTYLGGRGAEIGRAIAADAEGNAYVVGDTLSADFPVENALQPTFGGSSDAFVTEFNADGSALVLSSYLGGSSEDRGFGIAVDADGNVYVTGSTFSDDFPTWNPFQEARAGHFDVFVTRISPLEATPLRTDSSRRRAVAPSPP